MKKEKIKIEITGDANYIIPINNIGYCLCCGKVLKDWQKDFCDNFCKKEYWFGIKRDLNEFKGE